MSAGVFVSYWLLPRDRAPWQGLFDRSLVTPDEALVARAHERLWAGRLEGGGGALEAFAAALRRDPASPYRWCELGEAYLEAGRTEPARYCFRRGVALGPGTPAILMRAANMHFRLGENREALDYTRRVLAVTAEFDQVIFSSYARLGVSAEEALAQGVPRDRRAAQAFMRYLLAEGAVVSAAAVWPWVRSQAFADDALADEYTAFLLAQGRLASAQEVWAAHFGRRHPDFLRPNRVYNSGFEAEFAGRTFDWRVELLEGVEIERDNSTSAAGRWSLRLRFLGRENLAFQHVFQRVAVQPGPWRFRVQVRTEDLSTDQGLAFQIADAEDPSRLQTRTEAWLGTRDWTPFERGLVMPERTRLVELRLVRAASLKFDSKIRGTAWIDEVSLTPVR